MGDGLSSSVGSSASSGAIAPPMKTRISTSFSGPTGKLFAGEAAGDDLAAFNARDDEAEAVGRLAELVAAVGEADDGAAGVLDRGEVGGKLGVEIGQGAWRRRGRVGRRSWRRRLR